MSVASNIAGLPSLSGSSGNGGTGAAAKGGGEGQFGSLLATLMALTGNGNAGGANVTGSANATGKSGESGKSAQALLDNLLGKLDGNGKNGDGASPQDLLANLVDMLGQLARQVESGTNPDAALIKQVSGALEVLNQLLGKGQQASGAANMPASLVAQQQAASIDVETGLQQSSTLPDSFKALLKQAANTSPQAADKLAAIAQKLGDTLPGLSNRISELAQTLGKLNGDPAQAQQQAQAAAQGKAQAPQSQQPQQAPATANGQAQDADGNPALNLATAVKQATGKGDDGQEARPRITGAAEGKVNADKAPDLPGQHPRGATAQPGLASGQTGGAAVGAAAAANTLFDPASDSDSPADPLLVAQSGSQSSAKLNLAAAGRPGGAAYQAQNQQLNMPNIAFDMARHVRNGDSRFQIRLDPPDLGKIDVRMHMDNAGNVHARLTVERGDTLDLLQRDAKSLERALNQAGLDTSRTNLEFSLKQNPFAGQNGQGFGGGDGHLPLFDPGETETKDPVNHLAATQMYRGTASPGGVNLLA